MKTWVKVIGGKKITLLGSPPPAPRCGDKECEWLSCWPFLTAKADDGHVQL